MGMCISLASSEIHGNPNEVHDENIIKFEASNNNVQSDSNNKRLCSVYSKQGTKGFNQDAASIHQGEGIIIANLGDSRAVLGTICDEELKAIQLTTDLKPGLPSEAERIRRSNGCVYALKEEAHIERVWIPNNENSPGLAMSRAFGDFILKDHGVISIPHVSFHTLTSTDLFIVLASDGVWDVLSNNEVASIVWNTDPEEEAAKAVVEAANAAWKIKFPFSKIDDCTVVCLFLQKKASQKLLGHMETIKLY